MKKIYNVIIIDDHPLMRQGIKQLLGLDPIFTVVAETNNGREAITLARTFTPDIILLDLNMKGLSGRETLKMLRKECIDSRIIIITVSDARSDVHALLQAGADGYLLKDSEPEILLEKIREAAGGQRVVSDAIADQLALSYPDDNPFSTLTERELDVLQQVARGISNKQIATQLYISEETVKVHIRNLLRKLNIHSRAAAIVMYLEYKNQ